MFAFSHSIRNSCVFSQHCLSCIYLSLISVGGKLTREKVALILGTGDGNLNFSFLGSERNTSLWPGGVPWDGSPIVVENFPLLPLTIVCYIYATAGIVFAIVCLIFNIIFRNAKYIVCRPYSSNVYKDELILSDYVL